MAREVKKLKDELLDGFSVATEDDGNVHVRPIVDGDVIDTEVEEVIDFTDTTVEEVVEPVATEENPETDKDKTKYNKNIDFAGRGFSSFDEAKAFVKTGYFKGLGKEDQEEYLNWLKN